MFCFDHGLNYTEDQMICPKCEQEICEQHDKKLLEDYVNTEDLQLTSLVDFMAALGFESVWSVQGNLLRFKQPKLRFCGKEYMSVASAIKLHNSSAIEDVWKHLSTVNTDFKSFINTDEGLDMITLLFAGTVKVIETVKGQYKRGVGFFVHDTKSNHMIKFNTDRDAAHYKMHVFMEE